MPQTSQLAASYAETLLPSSEVMLTCPLGGNSESWASRIRPQTEIQEAFRFMQIPESPSALLSFQRYRHNELQGDPAHPGEAAPRQYIAR